MQGIRRDSLERESGPSTEEMERMLLQILVRKARIERLVTNNHGLRTTPSRPLLSARPRSQHVPYRVLKERTHSCHEHERACWTEELGFHFVCGFCDNYLH